MRCRTVAAHQATTGGRIAAPARPCRMVDYGLRIEGCGFPHPPGYQIPDSRFQIPRPPLSNCGLRTCHGVAEGEAGLKVADSPARHGLIEPEPVPVFEKVSTDR